MTGTTSGCRAERILHGTVHTIQASWTAHTGCWSKESPPCIISTMRKLARFRPGMLLAFGLASGAGAIAAVLWLADPWHTIGYWGAMLGMFMALGGHIRQVNYNDAVQAERDRLTSLVLAETPHDLEAINDAAPEGQAQDHNESAGSHWVRRGGIDQGSKRFALLLIDYYAFGLTQAKRSLAVSLVSSGAGGFVLLGGVGLALTGTSSHPTVPIVTSLAGVLTSGIGALFHRQANQALKHMEGQSRSLQEDMKAERDQRQAISLLVEVSEPQLKARLQAALILKFANAELPPMEHTSVSLIPPQNGHVSERAEA